MDFKLTLKFLEDLAQNNNKEWFDANKKTYNTAKEQWLAFVALLIKHIGAFDKDVALLEPKKCIFRINRDIRFSKNKDPYKTNFGATISKFGSKNEFCGYYFHLEPNKSFIAGGVYMPMPDKLAAIRQEIDYNFVEFKKIIENKAFIQNFKSLSGEKLQRQPKGYEADNPAIEFLKHKSFLVEKKISNAQLNHKDFVTNTINDFKLMLPLNNFLFRSFK